MGGKTSLHKFDKKNRSVFDNKLNIYYFPEIPAGLQPDTQPKAKDIESFKRSGFNKSNSTASNQSDTFISNQNSDKRMKESYLRGYEEGKRAGKQSEKTQLESMLNRSRLLLSEIEEIRNSIYVNSEKQMIRLIMDIAKKVVGQVSQNQEGIVLNVVKKALEKIVDSKTIKIRVHPSDVSTLKQEKYQLTDLLEQNNTMELEADEMVSPGGCVVETSLGEIDARLEKQLQVIEELFKLELCKSGCGR